MEIAIWKRISDDKPLGTVTVPECASDAEFDRLKSEILAVVKAMEADKAQEVERLRTALASLVEAVAGEQEDPRELEKALGKAAVPALVYARSLLRGGGIPK